MPWFLLSASATNTCTVRGGDWAASETLNIPRNNRSASQAWMIDLFAASLAMSRKRTLNANHLAFSQLVTCFAEAFIPAVDKATQKLAKIVTVNHLCGTSKFGPGVHARSAICNRFERDPLYQGVAKRMVNPGNVLARRADCYYVINYRLDRAQNLNTQAAARRPWFSHGPADVAIDVRKCRPKTKIRKELPRQGTISPGESCVLQILHTTCQQNSVTGAVIKAGESCYIGT